MKDERIIFYYTPANRYWPSKLLDSDRRKIIELRSTGLPYYKIAALFGVCTQTAINVCKSKNIL